MLERVVSDGFRGDTLEDSAKLAKAIRRYLSKLNQVQIP